MKFAGKVWRLLVGIKDALVLAFLMLFFALLYGALTMRPAAGHIEKGALLIELDGTVVEEKSRPDPISLLLSGEAPTREYEAREIERALRMAARDDRIKAVVIDMSRFLGAGQVHLREIGKAMDSVRAVGKPVLTFANAYADDGVLLAAHASEVWLDPMGGAFVAGPGGTHLFFKGLLDRFKVNAHVYRVGTFKSAVEPYLRADMSPEARKAYEDVYGALWADWKADVKAARPASRVVEMTRDPAGWMAANGGEFALGAKAAGLADRIGDRTEFEARVVKLVGETHGGSVNAKSAVPYAHTRLATWLSANPDKGEGAAIGVVTIAGEIVDGDAGPGKAGGDRIARMLDDNLDEGFKALVVRVDSPGGSVMASERIRRALLRYKAKKIPIVVSMGNLAASGGYWVSTPATRVFAQADTITGSIGVFAVVTSFEKTLADFGVTSDGVKTTPLSGQPDIVGGFDPALDALLQGSVEASYRKFLSLVGAARGKTPDEIDAIAQGRVWPGSEARKLGLVDEIGGLDAALAAAARLGGIGNGKWHAKFLEEPQDALTELLAGFEAGPQDDAAASDFAGLVARGHKQQLARALSQVDAMLSAEGVQAYCLGCPMPRGAGDAQKPGKGTAALVARLLGTGRP